MNSVNKTDKQNVEDILSLTSMQEGMLYHYINNSGNSEYLVQLSLTISGNIRADFVKKAWDFVVEANEMLRTVYRWQKLNNPLQIVLKKYNIPFNEIDLSKESENEKQVSLEIIREQCRIENIDISTESIKVTLCKLNSNQYEMIVTNHHIIFDGWSNGIILKDFMYAYNCYYHGDTLVLPVKNKFKEYIKWYKSLDKEAQKLYWGEYLHGFENNSSLFQASNIANKNIKSYGFKVSDDIREKVAEFSKSNKISTAALFYSIWGILLQKYSGEDDTVFGTTVSGRNPKIKGIEDMVGLFINTLPLRVTNQTDDIIDILSKVEKDLIERQDYESAALTDIKTYAHANRNVELFDSIVVVENYPLDVEQYKNNILHIDSYKSFDLTNYNMTVSITTFEDIEICFYYNQNILSEDSIKRLASHFNNILYSIVNKQVKKVSQIELLNEEEKQKLLDEFNDTYTDYPREKTIQELFEEQAGRTPDNIAVIFENNKLTYRELNEKSNRLARTLREKGVGPDSIVGIMVERSLEMVVGIMGILKAGGAYLPIDSNYPEDRVKFMLQDSKTTILLTQRYLLDRINFDGEILDLHEDSIYAENRENLEQINTSKDLAYIIYTSGSTGTPKGVMCEHKNVVRLVKNTNYIEFRNNDRILQTGSMVFDASTFEVWGALLNGLELYLAKNEVIVIPELLEKFIVDNKITILWLTSELFNQIAEEKVTLFRELRCLLVGGDVLSPKYINLLRRKCSKLKIINGYGPTENTTFSATFLIEKEYDSNIPIGKPIANSKAYILNENNKLVPVGVSGELCVSGEGLSRGYLNRPELTAEKFVDNPFEPGKKMYKTGDLARWLSDGNIEFIGRKDNQVKIRGFRIELGEIENRLLQHEDVKEAAVVVKENAERNKYICAYIVSEKEVSELNLREYLKENLPEYMIPAYFAGLAKMPITTNGKLDRKALPEPSLNVSSIEYEVPRNEIEEKLCKLWEEVLAVEKIGINDNFFELGGHSLKATVLAGRIHKELDIEIPLKKIFSSPTIKGISEYMQKSEKNIYASIDKVKKREYYEASSAQKRMYMLQQFDLNSTAYNMPAVMEIEGKLDFQKLEYSIKTLVKRHETLRTYFETIDGSIVQKISKEANFEVEYAEMYKEAQVESGAEQLEINRENKIDEVVKSFMKAFNLSKAPLLRVGLIKVQSEKYILMFDMHHIISDGVSMGVLISEFMKLYEGKELKELKLQYKDYSEWQNNLLKSEEMRKQEEYWLNKFSGEIPVLNMPTDHQRPGVKSFEGDRINFNLNKDLTKKLYKLGKETGSTLYMLLLSAVNILLSKYSGQEDIIVGSPIAGRSHADLEGIIGMFVNTLAMRNEPKGEKNYEEFLREVKENALKAYENQDYQFEELVDRLNIARDMGRNPLFDVMFAIQNMESQDIHLNEVIFRHNKNGKETAKFDITITAVEAGEEMAFDIEYCTKLYQKETIERMSEHLRNILKSIVENRNIRIADIELLGREEKHKLVYEFNDTYVEYPNQKTIHELFEEQVVSTPKNIAVTFENKRLTYSELNKRANSLARTLRGKGVGIDSVVGIMLNRSLEMIIGIIGILKAGGAYLPIDPDYPEDRVKYMLDDSETKLLLTQKHLLDRVSFTGEILNLLDETIYSEDGDDLENINTPNDLAYVIYTSGSTGKPKGVMIEQKSLINYINFCNEYYLESGINIFPLFTSIAFDLTVTSIYMPLLSGKTICVYDNRDNLSFIDIVKDKIDFMKLTPAHLSTINSLEIDKINIAKFIVGGEELSTRLSSEVYNKFNGGVEIINEYGPTEATVGCIVYRYKEEDKDLKTVPIGRPINNTRIYILDKTHNVVPTGIAGELWIAGEGVARGYVNKPELTAERFIEDPFYPGERMYKTGDLARWVSDGNIEFLGRIDHQVKIRGFRIELGEIESNILTYRGVKETVVIDREDVSGSKVLCAYIVSDNEIAAGDIKQHILKKLPEYMVPSYFLQLDKIPLTSNGKINRSALPIPKVGMNIRTEYEAPRNELEEKLCKVWGETLGVEKVGINDNFFELGGHSLKATILVSRIHKELDVGISIKEVFNTQTIKGLSEYLERAEKNIYSAIEKIEERDYYEASSAQKRMYMLQQFDLNSTVYNMPVVMEVEGKLDTQRFEYAIKTLIERHEALRTCFEITDSVIVQKISKNTNFEVEYASEFDEVQTEVIAGEQLEICRERIIYEIVKDFVKPFDLSKAPLFRVGLIKVQPEKFILMFDMHHIISDGVSMGIVITEFKKFYEGEKLKELKLQYKDYSNWQNNLLTSGEIKKQEEYWLSKYSGEIPVLNMPTDYKRPSIKSFEGDRINFSLGKGLAKKLKDLSKENGSTIYMVLLSVLNILISKYSGQEDIIIGSPIAGRPHADLEGIIGMFVNTLAIRNTPKGEKTYEEFLKEVRENALKAYENQDYQFEELVEKLNISREMSRNPLFDVMFVLENMEKEDLQLQGAIIKRNKYENRTSKFDLTITAVEAGEEILLGIEYSTKLFKKETIERMAGYLINIINSITADRKTKLKDIELLTEEEKDKLLREFNATYAEYPRDKTIHGLFEEQVEKTPQNTAVAFENEKLTYRELNEKANRLARTLREKGVRSGNIVGLMTEKSLELVIGILGILKAGGAYLPIDPAYPKDRVKYMLEDSKTSILLTQRHLLDRISFQGEAVNLMDDTIYSEISSNIENINTSKDLAYIIYTSGSTGRPKGVMLEHRGLLNLSVFFRKHLGINESDRIIQFASSSFDASVSEYFMALVSGAALHIPLEQEVYDVIKIQSYLKENKITIATLPPAYAALLKAEDNISLRTLITAGSETNIELINKWSKVTEYINAYGPTENTVCTSMWNTSEFNGKDILIGKPIDNIKVYVVNCSGKLQPIGVPGELCISGDGLARGYLNNPGLTAEKFVENPFTNGEKMYRTGDLGRWLADGNIEFLGRIDHQVKIRGFRIELGEIESNILTYREVREVSVIDREDESGSKYLCAYIVSDGEVTAHNIRQYLLKKLPEYMIPSYFVQLEKIPLTSNGKIDRKVLPRPECCMNIGDKYEAPRNEIEDKLCKVWEEILGVEKVGINDNFFELGGHSLKATILSSRIHKELDAHIHLKNIFSTPTIKELSEYIQKSEKSIYSAIKKAPEREYYEASSAQKRMYMLQQFDLNSTVYNMPAVIKVNGKLDADKIEYAVKALVERHESLRTSFETIEGEVVQRISKETSFEIEYAEGIEEAQTEAAAAIQLGVCSEERVDEAVKSFVRVFDLSKAPLLRVGLVKVQPESYILMFDIHHIISDGVSMGILITEFTKLYEGKELKKLKLQYKDYSRWQNQLRTSDEMKKQEEYWLNKFSGEVPVLNMPADHQRPGVKSFEGDRITFNLGKSLTKKLNKLGKETGSTLYMLLLSAVNILLSKYSGQEEIVIGSPIAGRPHADLEGIIGIFINTLAMRNEPKGEKTYEEFLKEVRENALKAYENQDYQFEELIDKLDVTRDMSRNPLFDVMLVLQNMESKDIELDEVQFKQYKSENRTSKFDLTITAEEARDEIVVGIEYCTKLFEKEKIERMAKHFTNILNLIVEDRKVSLKDIELLEEAEKNKLLYEFNDTYAEYPGKKTIHEIFEEQVQITPDNVAAVFDGHRLTYRELNERANSLARILRNRGVEAESIVGILAEKSLEMIVGIIGVLKAGGAYLPIDPSYPEDRIAYTLSDSGTNILLTQNFLISKVKFSGEIIDLNDADIYKEDTSNLESISIPENLAYIIYTSGTTGKPKGAMIEHKNVVRLLFNDKMLFDFNQCDVWTMFHSFCFDFSVWEMYGALLYGGKLVVVPKEVAQSPESYLRLLKKEKVTILNQVPSVFYNLIKEEVKTSEKELKLRYIIFGGEALKPIMLKPWEEKYPAARLINMYGITETTVHVTFKEIKKKDIEDNISNIGKSIPTLTTYIMDKNMKLLPLGVPGEICVGGLGVGRGYLNREELTKEKFVQNPYKPEEIIYRSGDAARILPSGDMEYLGRIDQQVKIRGFRIELREIESNILTYEGVKEVVVIDREDEGENKYLCAYIVSDDEIIVGDIRQHLLKKLPEYMVPSYFVQIDCIPLTANGKLDRKALPMPEGGKNIGTKYEAPRNYMEEKLSLVWEEALGVEKVGINDNFFELGGHSLKATVLVSKIHKEFDVEISMKEVFNTPTIKGISQYIQEAEKNIYLSIEKAPEREYYEASSAQKRMYMLQQFDLNSIVYNMPIVMEVKGKLELKRLEYAVQALIERHETLRTSFETIDDRIVQRISKVTNFEIEYSEVSEQAQVEKAAEVQLEACREERIDETVKNFVRAFDLSKAPLLRVGLIKIQSENYILMFDTHHIISDGVSMGILISEFMKLYEEEELKELKLQYKDYSYWQNRLLNSDEMRKQAEYWLNRFSGEIPVLNMPTDYHRPLVRSFEGDRISFNLDKELAKKLNKLSKDTGSTLYMLLLSAVNILLSKYSGQEDIIVGSPIAGRPHTELQNIIGMFVNTLAMRNEPRGDKIYEEFLSEVRENALKAYENQDYQFEELIEKLNITRDISRNPLFDVLFALQNIENDDIHLKEAVFKQHMDGNKTAKFDLTMIAFEVEEEIIINIEYSTKIFKKATVERMAVHFKNILNLITADRKINLRDIEFLGAEEKQKLLYEFNNTYVEYPRDKTIYELFEEQVIRTPENIAVVFEDNKLTYRELNERANRLARNLRKKGVGPDSIVGIMVEKSIEMIVGIVGTLKAGGAYLPIDPNHPEDRVKYMLDDSNTMVLLTQKHLLDSISFDGEIIDLLDDTSYSENVCNLGKVNTSRDLAYIIYTSGSTGRPKGIMVEHKNLVNLCIWHNTYFNVTSNDRAAQYASISFDASVWEIFPYMLQGASIYIIPSELRLDIEQLNKYYELNHITIGFLPTQICEEFIKFNNNSLRKLITGGDKLKNYNKQSYTIINNYGPTENTVVTTKFIVDKQYNNIPIGSGISNNYIYIVDAHNNLQPIGVPGELCISGEGLARGYLNNPELTTEKFIENPFVKDQRMYKTGDLARWLTDGNIEFLGRIDHQVKIRGFRIELGEIESNILAYCGVREASVINSEDESGSKCLCAYIVCDGEITDQEIKQHLFKKLPEYMVPSYFVQLDKMPLTPNGKLDRKALPEPEYGTNIGAEYEAPRNDVEEKLCQICGEVLGVEKVGINDSFFELGGDSIKAIQVISRLKKYGYTIEVKDMFKNPLIGELGGYVKENRLQINQGTIEGKVELSPIQKWFFEQNFTDMHHWNQAVMLFKKDGFADDIVGKVIQAIAMHHDALRMIYNNENTYITQINRGSFENMCNLEIFDFRDIEDYEGRIEAEANRIQGSIHLSEGPLMKLALFNTDIGDHLLIVIHHLVIDGVSWRIFFEDFARGYMQCLNGQEIIFEEKTTSFKEWTENLKKYSLEKTVLKEIEYWRKVESTAVKPLPKDNNSYESILEDAKKIGIILTKDETEKLLRNVNSAYNTEINEILLTALGLTIKEWTGEDEVLVNLEGHGREDILERVDISRTIGWFTSQYPLILHMNKSEDISYLIKNTKELLRNVPNKGIGYGIIRYLTDESLKKNIEFRLTPEICFNYLGQFDQDIPLDIFEVSRLSSGEPISLKNANQYLLNISGMVAEGKLEIMFMYDSFRYEDKTIQNISELYKKNLKRLIEHCIEKEEVEITPADLDAEGLTLEELDFLKSLGGDI